MKKTALLLTAFAICAYPAAAANDVRPSARATLAEPARPEPERLVADATADRAQLAACVNLARLRALDARSVGANDAAQNRILDVAFVFCMTGSMSAD